MMTFAADEDFARQLDSEDSLRQFRENFISRSAKMGSR
jgi:hypothetical protein